MLFSAHYLSFNWFSDSSAARGNQAKGGWRTDGQEAAEQTPLSQSLWKLEVCPSWAKRNLSISLNFRIFYVYNCCCSVATSHLTLCNPTDWVCSNSCSCLLSQWCCLDISSSVAPFSFHPQSFPASGSFPMSWHFISGGQSIGASDSASILPMNIEGWFLLGLTGWISLQSKGLSRVFSSTTVGKHQFFKIRLLMVQLSHPYMTTGKTTDLTIRTFVSKIWPTRYTIYLLYFFLICLTLPEYRLSENNESVSFAH